MEADYLSRAHIIKYHKDNIKNFGLDSNEALGWKNRENQQLRFEIITQAGNFQDRSVMDLGCGTGDLLDFLDKKNISCSYTGMDQVKEFIEFAGQKYKEHPNASFLLGDFWSAGLPFYDYVVASGSLNYRTSDPDFIYKMIFRLYCLSNIAFIFNLPGCTELKNGGLTSYDKSRIVAYCKKICTNVKLIDNYLEEDYTIVLEK